MVFNHKSGLVEKPICRNLLENGFSCGNHL